MAKKTKIPKSKGKKSKGKKSKASKRTRPGLLAVGSVIWSPQQS